MERTKQKKKSGLFFFFDVENKSMSNSTFIYFDYLYSNTKVD